MKKINGTSKMEKQPGPSAMQKGKSVAEQRTSAVVMNGPNDCWPCSSQ